MAAGNAGRTMARRVIANLRAPRCHASILMRQQVRSFRIPREIAALDSLMPFHSTLASARLVSRLSGGLVPCFQGCQFCSTSRNSSEGGPSSATSTAASSGRSFLQDKENAVESSEGELYSDSEELWSHDEEEDGSNTDSNFEEGDSLLNDSDLWDTQQLRDELRDEAQVHNQVKENSSESEEDVEPSSVVQELARVLPGLDPDAMKKAEEQFRQEQGVAARARKEAGTYLRQMKKEYDARSLVQDEHCLKVHQKLADLKPGSDGRYRNLIEMVSDTDVLLEAYRRVKAGPGGDPSKVPIDNISMEWFYETQAKLRAGTFELSPIKVVEIEKRELPRIERKAKPFKRFYRGRKRAEPY